MLSYKLKDNSGLSGVSQGQTTVINSPSLAYRDMETLEIISPVYPMECSLKEQARFSRLWSWLTTDGLHSPGTSLSCQASASQLSGEATQHSTCNKHFLLQPAHTLWCQGKRQQSFLPSCKRERNERSENLGVSQRVNYKLWMIQR